MTKFELERKYNISRMNILLLIGLSVINIGTLIYSNSYFLFSLSFPRFVQLIIDYWVTEGLISQEQINYPLMVFIMALPILLFLLCYIFTSKNRYKVFIFAIILFVIDSIFALITFDPIDIIFHIYIFVLLVLGIKYGRKIAKGDYKQAEYVTQSSLDENGDVIESEDSKVLRYSEEKGRVLIKADYNGLNISIKRSKGLTELIVNNKVYDERKGIIEKAYQLNAKVNNNVINFVYENSMMYIYTNGQLLIKKIRWI